ncbi:hypothetical protein FDT66_13305 [Polaribacter aestuariivivens]|uniref:Outer membrane protein beta-barrel domain-containing protein n=1 Tax=Polaribacter aestuariivivens TaxID=2304626 RepID=A0A5S3N7M1_9FLAO|nr:hypothetical protein [Polaribacter aestuariivivens]TMM28876.1 hypothetical protein FDT66_13305 [Polaribacter aestuariivivens]
MKKIVLTLLLVSLNSFAQSTFRKGFMKTKADTKIDAYIMVFGYNIQEKVYYKTNKNSSKIHEISVEELNELSTEKTKYIRKQVSIEFLEKNMYAKNQNNSNKFNLSTANLFLKIELDAKNFTFYSYEKDGNEYYFVEKNNTINWLEFKKIKNNNKTFEVRNYRKQLLDEYKLKSVNKRGYIGSIKYKKKSLIEYFLKYANDENINSKNFSKITDSRDLKDLISITPKIGYSFYNQDTKAVQSNSFNSSFNSNNLNVGLDIELFFNTIYKKNSFIFSLQHHFKSETKDSINFGASSPVNVEIANNIGLTNLILSYRHYFKISDEKYIYSNAGVAYNLHSGSTKYTYTNGNEEANLTYNNTYSLFLSVGLNIKKYTVELNFMPISGDFKSKTDNEGISDWKFKRSVLSFNIGYEIF